MQGSPGSSVLLRSTVHAMLLPPRPVPAGHSSSFARSLSQVCTGWRRGLGEERAALQRLRFSRLELLPAPCGSGSSSTAAAARQPGRSGHPTLPWLVQQAVQAGNVAATVAAARWLEHQQAPGRGQGGRRPAGPRSAAAAAALSGTIYNSCIAAAAAVQAAAAAAGPPYPDEAARYWRKAAKLGHPEAQWKLGWGHYKVGGGANCLCCQLPCASASRLWGGTLVSTVCWAPAFDWHTGCAALCRASWDWRMTGKRRCSGWAGLPASCQRWWATAQRAAPAAAAVRRPSAGRRLR